MVVAMAMANNGYVLLSPFPSALRTTPWVLAGAFAHANCIGNHSMSVWAAFSSRLLSTSQILRMR